MWIFVEIINKRAKLFITILYSCDSSKRKRNYKKGFQTFVNASIVDTVPNESDYFYWVFFFFFIYIESFQLPLGQICLDKRNVWPQVMANNLPYIKDPEELNKSKIEDEDDIPIVDIEMDGDLSPKQKRVFVKMLAKLIRCILSVNTSFSEWTNNILFCLLPFFFFFCVVKGITKRKMQTIFYLICSVMRAQTCFQWANF